MVTRDEANERLAEIERLETRSERAAGYREAAPYLLLWGVIWLLGYGLPATGVVGYGIWPWLIPVGVVASFWFGRSGMAAGSSRFVRRYAAAVYAAAVVAAMLFIAALFSIFMPITGRQIGTVFPVIVGAAYLQLGIWTGGLRIAVVGLVITAAALYAYHGAPEIFDLLMAIIGGGGLILGGLWLRRL